jgi:poly(3-hydroxybutyrate) depolymerase
VEDRVVWRKPFCRLLHFQRDPDVLKATGHENDPRLLIVAPLSGHYATLLRGTAEALLPDHEVYITDWSDARMVPIIEGRFGVEDYTDYVIEILRWLGPGTHVMAVCQPSVPVLAAISIMSMREDPAVPASATLMGGPIDTRRNPTAPNNLATARPIEWFERNVIFPVPPPYPGVLRRVYPGFLQLTGFMTMNLDRHLDAHQQLFWDLVDGDGDGVDEHRKFYDEYLSVLDMTAEFYLETVRRVFQEQHLARGLWDHRGVRVDPGAITKTALLCVEGERDDISGLGQTAAALDLATHIPADHKRHYIQPRVGHYGVFNGSRWRNEIRPRVAEFIRDFDKPKKA